MWFNANQVTPTHGLGCRVSTDPARHSAGVDGEALFIGTIMHSTDHAQHIHLLDPFLLFDAAPAFTQQNSLSLLLTNGCLSHSLPLLGMMYDFTFKNSPHPLFSETYMFAREINQRLADEMECCVVR